MSTTPNTVLPARLRFPGLSSTAYEHPADRAALEALRATPGLDRLFRWLSDIGFERYARLFFTADSLRISPKQCPRLYNDLREACTILDVREPEFYLIQHPYPVSYALGMQRHIVVISSSLVDLLSDTERLFVIGRELGHIKSDHMLYRTMALVLASLLAANSPYLNIPGELLVRTLLYTLFAWFRKSELSADRAGLLVVQDPEICINAILKRVAGTQKLTDDLDAAEFVRQADLFDDMEDDLLSVYYKFKMLRFNPEPFPAVRAREVLDWSRSREYQRLLRGEYPYARKTASERVCEQCGYSVSNVSFRFCPECGSPLPPLLPEYPEPI